MSPRSSGLRNRPRTRRRPRSRKRRHVDGMCCSQRPIAGSRFGSCPEALVPFLLARGSPNKGAKQAAPGNYRTRCFAESCRSGVLDPLNVATNLSRVETFAGAACLRSFAAMHTPRQTSRGLWVRSKAAPLQTLGNRVRHERRRPQKPRRLRLRARFVPLLSFQQRPANLRNKPRTPIDESRVQLDQVGPGIETGHRVGYIHDSTHGNYG